jgi:hypothetical protein
VNGRAQASGEDPDPDPRVIAETVCDACDGTGRVLQVETRRNGSRVGWYRPCALCASLGVRPADG